MRAAHNLGWSHRPSDNRRFRGGCLSALTRRTSLSRSHGHRAVPSDPPRPWKKWSPYIGNPRV